MESKKSCERFVPFEEMVKSDRKLVNVSRCGHFFLSFSFFGWRVETFESRIKAREIKER